MANEGLTLQELSDNIRQRLTGDFDETKKALEELYKKSNIGDNLDNIKKDLEKSFKSVTDVANDPKIKEFVKKPDIFFKKWIVDPITKTFNSNIVKPITTAAQENVFKPLSTGLNEGFKAGEKAIRSGLSPIQRSLESAGQYLRTIQGNIRAVEKAGEKILSGVVSSSKSLTFLSANVSGIASALAPVLKTAVRFLPIIEAIITQYKLQGLQNALDAQKRQLTLLENIQTYMKGTIGGRVNTLEVKLNQILTKLSTPTKSPDDRSGEILAKLNRIESQLKAGEKVDLSPVQSQLSDIQDRLRALERPTAPKVDLSPLQSQLNGLQSSVNRIPTTASKVDLSPLQSQLTNLQSSIAKLPTTGAKTDLSPLQSQLTSIQNQLSAVQTVVSRSPAQQPSVDLSPLSSQLASIQNSIARIPTTSPAPIAPDLSSVLQAISNVASLVQPLGGVPNTLARIATKQAECCFEFNTGNNNILGNLADVLGAIDGVRSDIDGLERQINYTPPGEPSEQYKDDISGIISLLQQIFGEIVTAKKLTIRSYNILGGGSWFQGDSDTPNRIVNPETSIKFDAAKHYVEDYVADYQVGSLLGYITAMNVPTFHRSGFYQYPATLPKTLLAYSDGETLAIHNTVDFVGWIVQQMDALIGKFPIEITIQDSDPTQEGNQEKKVELPNLSEAIAELYGLAITGSTNSDVAINMLMRLAAEVIGTKNAALVTQDYVKANASYLGYNGNPKKREVDYSFDPEELDTLDKFLKESKGYIVGWEEDDKNSVAEYMKKLMFSAGIIKSVFFRNQSGLDRLKREIEGLAEKDTEKDKQAWDKFRQELNDPISKYNKDTDNPQPKIKDNPFTPEDGSAANS